MTTFAKQRTKVTKKNIMNNENVYQYRRTYDQSGDDMYE